MRMRRRRGRRAAHGMGGSAQARPWRQELGREGLVGVSLRPGRIWARAVLNTA